MGLSAHRWPLIVAVAALCATSACGHLAGAPPIDWPRTLAPFSADQRLSAAPSFTTEITWPSSLTVASDASLAAGDGPHGPWAVTAAGGTVPLPAAAGSAVFALPDGLVAAGPGFADPPGAVSIFNESGAVLWSTPAAGPVSVTASAHATRILVLDQGTGSGTLLGRIADGLTALSVPALRALPLGAEGQLDAAGDLLLIDQQQVVWISSPGDTILWAVRANGSAVPLSRQVAVAPDGRYVTAATGQGDNTLYQFALSGSAPSLMWTEPLPAGGNDLLQVAPDGDIALWDVGNAATVAVYRGTDGAMLWQDTILGRAQAVPTVQGVAFGPSGSLVLSVNGCVGASPCLLFLGPTGRSLGYVLLPPGSRAILASDGDAAVAASPAGPGVDAAFSWWNLSSLWQAILPGGYVSSAAT